MVAMLARISVVFLSIGLASFGQGPAGGFSITDFGALKTISLVKDAKRAGGVLRVAPAQRYKTGAAWMTEKQPVSQGFETVFQFQLTSQDRDVYAGADGLAFVIQNVGPGVIAGRGAAGGFALGRGNQNPAKRGIPRSLAVFFDTYLNEDEEDPSGNYVAIFTNGDGYWLPRRLAHSPRLDVNLKDGQVHTVKIVYNTPRLSVYLDGSNEPVLSAAIDMASVVGEDGMGFVGFTAATGEGWQNHDVRSWSFGPRAPVESSESKIQFLEQNCLPNRTLCTPERPTVEERENGRVHIILPANLEWGVSLPNPGMHPVRLSNTSGTACWNPQGQGAHACGGPDGDASKKGALRPNSAAGALVYEIREGKTFFSVNGTPGAFEKNEGYFEFDVVLAPAARKR
jgi:hypothetical protein